MNTISYQNPIHVIGTDASGIKGIPVPQQQIILSSKRLAAPKRLFKVVHDWYTHKNNQSLLPELFPSDRPNELITWLTKLDEASVVLASGDPLWFGIGRSLLEAFPSERLIFHPAPSSFQLAFARLGRSWQDASWISLHGRDPAPLAKILQKRPKALAVLTDPSRGGIEEVRKTLVASGLENTYSLWLCERLGHKEERIVQIESKAGAVDDIHPLHLAILLSEEKTIKDPKNLPHFGLKDGLFLQHDDRPGLMTKLEIRVQLLAALELPKEGVIWDLGAGVGSVGLEAIRMVPNLKLLSVDKRIGSNYLIKKNANRLGVKPTAIIEDEIINVLNGSTIPKDAIYPDRILLGGGGNNKSEILKLTLEVLNPGGIIVVPLVTLEKLGEFRKIFESYNCNLTISQHQAWRGVPLVDGTRLSPMNPVLIIKGEKPLQIN